MNYRSFADLNDQIVRWIGILPTDIELVVGIPRSGLLVANLLAMYLNVPMTDVEGLVNGKMLRSGARYNGGSPEAFLAKPRSVLVVDDSVSYGGQMGKVRAEIASAGLAHHIRYAAVFITPEAYDSRHVDFFCEVVPRPRVFEWNVMHHRSVLGRACVEIDGVLSRFPPAALYAGERSRRRFIEQAEPLWRPRFGLAWVVTSRPEKYRGITEDWLARHDVTYTGLLMMENSPEAKGDGMESLARFKADAYVSTGASLLIEYSAELSSSIAKLADRPVFCVQTREMILPGTESNPKRRPGSSLARWAVDSYHEAARIPRVVFGRLARFAR